MFLVGKRFTKGIDRKHAMVTRFSDRDENSMLEDQPWPFVPYCGGFGMTQLLLDLQTIMPDFKVTRAYTAKVSEQITLLNWAILYKNRIEWIWNRMWTFLYDQQQEKLKLWLGLCFKMRKTARRDESAALPLAVSVSREANQWSYLWRRFLTALPAPNTDKCSKTLSHMGQWGSGVHFGIGANQRLANQMLTSSTWWCDINSLT